MGKIVDFLKAIPIDLGQGNLRTTTKGKLIAMEHVPVGTGKTALDIGCREGHQSRWLESKGYSVTSIDIEKNYEKAVVVDANGPFPYSENSFDLVWCSEVIEHLDDPECFLNEVARILKPGGLLLLTTPNSAFWVYPLLRLFGHTPQSLQHPGHKHFFDIDDMRKLFPEVHVFGFFPYLWLRCKIRHGVGVLSPTFVVCRERRSHGSSS